MSELISKKSITPKYSDISGNKEKRQRMDEKVKKDNEEGAKLSKRLSNVADITAKQSDAITNSVNLYDTRLYDNDISNFISKGKKEMKKKKKKDSYNAFIESNQMQIRQKEDEIKLKEMEAAKKKQIDNMQCPIYFNSEWVLGFFLKVNFNLVAK